MRESWAPPRRDSDAVVVLFPVSGSMSGMGLGFRV